MEKSQPITFTETVSDLIDLSRSLIGHDQETVRTIVSETLQTARVNHQDELDKAQTRRTHFRRKADTTLRRFTPTKETSLLVTLAQLVEMNERQESESSFQHRNSLWPQAYINRYSLELLVQSLQSPFAAIVVAMMVQHDYLQREARGAFELITQHSAAQKNDTKFYEKRKEIKARAKDRFEQSNFFQLTPSGTNIQTVTISEDQAEANYAFLEVCAHLVGQPSFSAPFNPSTPIPELITDGHNFDEENAVEHRRIQAVVKPTSLENLIESLGYTNMKKQARGPVFNTVISGNGHGGIRGTPLFEESEADKQREINAVINDYAERAGFRRELKHPELEVVVDGMPISKPFATAFTNMCHFELPCAAKYVQVFATQNGRREIISNLVLPQTQISDGRSWRSEVELEGQQKVSLTVEPRLDESGNLAGASLLVDYQPRVTWFEKMVAFLKSLWGHGNQVWPALATKAIVSCAIGLLALAPFFTIDIASVAALVTLVLSVTAFLIVIGKIKPAWRLMWPQQVAVDGFVSMMLIAMLLLGLLPIGSKRNKSVVVTAPAGGSTPQSNWANEAGQQVSFLPESNAHCSAFVYQAWRSYSSETLWGTQIGMPGDTNTRYSYVSLVSKTPSVVSYTLAGNHFHFAVDPWGRFNSIWSANGNAGRYEKVDDQTLAYRKKRENVRKAHTTEPTVAQNVALHETFHVEVLVDTKQIITLMKSAAPASLLSQSMDQPTIVRVSTAGTFTKGEPTGSSTGETPDILTEVKPARTNPGIVVSSQETPALVVFESPMRLWNLSKGDVLNANFKPIALSAADPRGETLVCTATGVVEDIRRTNSTGVQVRVGLVLTWSSGGNTVNRELQLLLTDGSKKTENSHYGVLAAPQVMASAIGVERLPFRKR